MTVAEAMILKLKELKDNNEMPKPELCLNLKTNNMNTYDPNEVEKNEFWEDTEWEDLEEDAYRPEITDSTKNLIVDACWSELLDREIDDDIFD